MDDVLGNYLDSLSEREFDAPLMSLLRGLGFYDIHFLHGAFEWGKDFIAKRTEEEGPVQYAFHLRAETLTSRLGGLSGARSMIYGRTP